jgi:diguanylate cyclase (GGDEF)-like protein
MTKLLDRLSLRQLLIVPYLVLLTVLVFVVARVLDRAATEAVDDLSRQLVTDTVERVAQATRSHMDGARAVLEAAMPMGTVAPTDLDDQTLIDLRRRLWTATSIHREGYNFVYYSNERGQSVALLRQSEVEAELSVNTDVSSASRNYRVVGIDGTARFVDLDVRPFDPRRRSWYEAARATRRHAWSPVYADYFSGDLVITRSRRVEDAKGNIGGVVGTDVRLAAITNFLTSMQPSANTRVFVLEPNGDLIGTSSGAVLVDRSTDSQATQRRNATLSDDPMVRAAYAVAREAIDSSTAPTPSTTPAMSRRTRLIDVDDDRIEVGWGRLQDNAGLNWWLVVAMPRSDYIQPIQASRREALAWTVAAGLGAALLGLLVIAAVARRLRVLAHAAQNVSRGMRVNFGGVSHGDEVGHLTRAFARMQEALLTDSLTGLGTRVALLRNAEHRLTQRRAQGVTQPFAILRMDFDRTKSINDTLGTEAGDAALRELADRLKKVMRPDDMAVRLASDEFALLLDPIDGAAHLQSVRETLAQALNVPLESLARAPDLQRRTATVGVAVWPWDADDAGDLFKQAGDDMRSRKRRTR